MENPFLVIGHRGVAARIPENTLESFRCAFEDLKADMIEFDVHLSKDGIPVIIHDAKLERTTQGRGYVSHFDLKDLRLLDAGYRFDPGGKQTFPFRAKGLAIPTLEEVFLRFTDRKLAIEVKPKSAPLVHAVMKLVKKFKAEDRCIVGSKHHLVSQTMRRDYPETKRFFSQREFVSAYFDHRRQATPKPDPQAVASMPLKGCHLPFDDASFIRFLHAKKTGVFYWTINDPAVMKALAEKQSDGIITDDPGAARKALFNSP